EADAPPVRQSERGGVYERALDGLRRQGLVYACNCSRAEVLRSVRPERADLQAIDAGPAFQAGRDGRPERPPLDLNADAELRYPGTCRERGLAEGPGIGVRVRLAPSVERFVDLRHGPQEQRPHEQCGDLLVRDREGNWTYQFAATVDDCVQGVTLVVRGD